MTEAQLTLVAVATGTASRKPGCLAGIVLLLVRMSFKCQLLTTAPGNKKPARGGHCHVAQALRFHLSLGLSIGFRLPLHVHVRISTTAGQRVDVVDNVAIAWPLARFSAETYLHMG